MHELSLQSERRTQLIDITDRVRQAVAGERGGAVLVGGSVAIGRLA